LSQNLDAKISESVKRGVKDALSPMLQGLMGGVIMPVMPSALAMLNGWTWKSEIIQDRVILTRGGAPVNPIAPIQGEKGWINLLGVIFSDPLSELRFQCDNWTVNWSPFQVNLIGGVQANNSNNYVTVYNPATPVGPLYGVQWTPSQFWPYNTQIVVQVSHPATAPTATSQLVAFYLGRHYIRDEKQFYESVIREGTKQTIGKVQVPSR